MNWKLHRLYKMLKYKKTDARRYGHLALESFDIEGETFAFMGWNYDRTHREMTDRRLVLRNQAGDMLFSAPLPGLMRKDLVVHIQDPDALYAGFCGKIRVATAERLNASIEYESKGRTYSTALFVVEPNCTVCDIPQIDWVFPYPEVNGEERERSAQVIESIAPDDDVVWDEVDVVVPVYNGIQFLPKLFESIAQTDVPYRLVIVDDASPDAEVRGYLDGYAAEHPDHVVLIRNEENLGFLRSVNKGLENTTHNVVIVNTDVELPKGWLERMILPVIEDPSIASVTPFTNSGTICSFPRFCEDNHLQAGMSVQEMDEHFKKLPLELFDVPTGVGFCMTMSRKALDDIGAFDEESFGRGYAEENDWCQRAIAAGYRNVHVGNLFVYHNHGGSFQSDEKKQLIRSHLEVLARKHPRYDSDVQDYIKRDPARHLRGLVQREAVLASQAFSVVFLDHNLGGGATFYANKRRKEFLEEGKRVTVVQYDEGLNLFLVVSQWDDMECRLSAKDMSTVFSSIGKIDEIWVNELVSYPNVAQLLQLLPKFASEHHAKLIFPLHDFFALCQDYNLINYEKRFCGLPDHAVCNACFHRIRKGEFFGSGIGEYRHFWGDFLGKCDKILCFSKSSRELLDRVYPGLENVELRPHEVDPLPFIDRKARMRHRLTVGVMGILTYTKGRDKVKELYDHIKEHHLDIDLVMMGETDKVFPELEALETGWYEREDIPKLALREGIDVFLIPSIWPETFSYTTAEIMSMGYPIAVFDLGAPAERVIDYDRGIVIPLDAGPEEVVSALTELAFDTVHIDDLPTRREQAYLLISDEYAGEAVLDAYELRLLEEGYVPTAITMSEMSRSRLEPEWPVSMATELILDEDIEEATSFIDARGMEKRVLAM